MTINRTTLLSLPLPVTGTEAGSWGDVTNNGLSEYMDIAIAGMTSLTSADFTAGALTISNTDGTAASSNIVNASAQYSTIKVSSLATNSTITAPSSNRSYRVINADSTYTLTIKASGQTGVTFQPGQSGIVAYNGTDYAVVGVVLNQAQTFTAAQIFRAANAVRSEVASTQDAVVLAGRAGGSGSYAVTLTPTTLSSNTTLTLPNVNDTISVLGTAQTFTAKQTFNGSTSVLAAALKNIVEPATVSATAATGTINYDVTTQSVLYYTSNASANWTVNFRASSGTSLNTAMATGDVVTVVFLVTQGATAYYNNAVQVDGSSVTPKWQNGGAPTAGYASSIDVYTYTIIKTASATFTVLASQTKFA